MNWQAIGEESWRDPTLQTGELGYCRIMEYIGLADHMAEYDPHKHYQVTLSVS